MSYDYRKLCDYLSHDGYGRSGDICPQCSPDLTRPISAPGPVSYSEAMADSRKLRWRRWPSQLPAMIDLGKVYIGTRYNSEEDLWQLGRVVWCEECEQFEMQQNRSLHARMHERADITHYADDILGTPY